MAGRPKKEAEIRATRALERDDLTNLRRGKASAVKKLRDSHHRMAQLFASGMRPAQVASITGYSLSRVSSLRGDPAFEDLIDQKRGVREAPLKDAMQVYNQMILENGIKAERKLADKLDDDDETEELSVRELISISRDAADRVGLSKRSIQMNIDGSFASLLDRAIARSREVLPPSGDLKLVTNLSSQSPEGGSLVETAHPHSDTKVEILPNPKVVAFKRRM